MWQDTKTGEWLDKRYSFEEVLNGDPYSDMSDAPLLRNYHHKETREWTGLNDATRWEELTEDERTEWVRAGNMPGDWKGKPIYEGEIIKGGIQKNPIVNVVKFNPAYGCPMRFRPDHEWGDNDRGAGEFLDRQTISSNIGFKTIGNIYENPELLK